MTDKKPLTLDNAADMTKPQIRSAWKRATPAQKDAIALETLIYVAGLVKRQDGGS